MPHSILYSFRRCPYAMRARLAIAVSGVQVILREVALKNKPEHLLSISAKATVPVLMVAEGDIIDESLDIMHWALQRHDPDGWLKLTPKQYKMSSQLIQSNDGEFKHWLDKYKYADRYPEHSEHYYRQQAELTLAVLEQKLTDNDFLISKHPSLADVALWPFIRQFAFVDKDWFDSAPYPHVRIWLMYFINSDLFNNIMAKVAPWQENDAPHYFPTPKI